jgi:predicted ATPase
MQHCWRDRSSAGVALSPELEKYVAERAGGNPFFVEELFHALQETGGIVERQGQMHLVPAAPQRLPSTLTEILLARLDGLEEQVRTVAQVGSVIRRSWCRNDGKDCIFRRSEPLPRCTHPTSMWR